MRILLHEAPRGGPTGLAVALSLAVYAAYAAYVYRDPWPALHVVSGGRPLLEERFAWDGLAAREVLGALGEVGREAYLRFQFVDAFLALLAALALTNAIGFAAVRLFRVHHPLQWIAALPITLATIDLLEDAAIAALAIRFPGDPGWIARMGGFMTSAKLVLTPLTLVVAALALVAAGVRGYRRRQGITFDDAEG